MTLCDTAITQSSQVRYPGIALDKTLSWKPHIESLSRKLAYGCHLLIKCSRIFPLHVMKLLYFSFIQSHLTYCLETWGSTYHTYLKVLITLQKRAVRIITGTNNRSPSNVLLNALQFLTLEQLVVQRWAQIMNNVIRNNFPINASNLQQPRRLTRMQTDKKFIISSAKNIYGTRTLQHLGVRIWNQLPIEIRNTQLLSKTLRDFILSEDPMHIW